MLKVNYENSKGVQSCSVVNSKLEHDNKTLDTRCKLNVHQTFRRRDLVLCMLNLHLMSRGARQTGVQILT